MARRRGRGHRRRRGGLTAPFGGRIKRGGRRGRRKGGFIGPLLGSVLPQLIGPGISLVKSLFKKKSAGRISRRRRRAGAINTPINSGPLA